MDKRCLILFGIVIILCMIAVTSSGSHKTNGIGETVDIDEKIGFFRFDSGVTNYSSINNNNSIDEYYIYSVFFDLDNVSSWYDGGEIIVYFYNNGGIVLSDEVTYKSNNTTIQIDNNTYDKDYESFNGYASLISHKFINITHVTILLIKDDGTVVFNETKQFDMTNYNEYNPNLYNSSNTTSDESNTSSSDEDIYYVASDNSDVFHEWYCTHASKISDSSKITFQDREDAINQGYTPCKVCSA